MLAARHYRRCAPFSSRPNRNVDSTFSHRRVQCHNKDPSPLVFMGFQVIEVSPPDIILDRAGLERDDGFIYEHLKRYCSKFVPLPAITVGLRDRQLVTLRGHKYLSIARELRHEKIRAVLQGTSFDELRKLGVSGLLSIVPKALLERERETSIVTGWHIFFFRAQPSPEKAARIEASFRRFLNQSLPGVLGVEGELSIASHFDSDGPCLEIQFPTPVTNQAWADSYHFFISSVS